RALGDDPSERESELECINRYRTTMAGKAALVVIDDVWRLADLETFRVDAQRSRLLFTTRDDSIAAAMDAEEYVLWLLSPHQAKAVFGEWSGVSYKDLPPIANDLIHECGYLPLALSIIGATLRRRPLTYWREAHKLLQSDLGVKFPSLLRAIELSVDTLDQV